MKDTKQVRVFSNATEYAFWTENNCLKCLKCLDNTLGEAEEGFHKGECEIYEYNLLAGFDSGEIPIEIAQRMGYENKKLAAKCKEFVTDKDDFALSGDLFEQKKLVCKACEEEVSTINYECNF